jgi:hypothetical protein
MSSTAMMAQVTDSFITKLLLIVSHKPWMAGKKRLRFWKNIWYRNLKGFENL